ncbi:hydrolase [Candidatus Acidianus copahuensis]|uniref:Hydrolase n=1 Tax=Candidatus Acidianus copahuensis TaxID=1160895 RepID=A0A031LTI4_9CREN|nr:MBL fold metallo-hydrolase [Candidatus Acidianus copahuensis]EZQ10819.1 hydrolase [Candidatus Acidianus copahuensis]
MINYFGHSMVSINDEIVIDPHDGGSIGLKRPEISSCNLILMTHNHYDHNAYELIEHKEAKLSFYGNFEYLGYKISGYKAYHDKVKGKRRGETAIYKVSWNNHVLVHLGDIGEFPKENIMKEISNPDILFLPIGGLITINSEEAISLAKDLEPKAIIPIHYWVKGSLLPLDPPDQFLSKIGQKIIEVKKSLDENNLEKAVYFITA